MPPAELPLIRSPRVKPEDRRHLLPQGEKVFDVSCLPHSATQPISPPCVAARCVRNSFPGALSISKGAVTGRARGLGHNGAHLRCRFPGIDTSDGRGGYALLPPRPS